MIQLAEKDNKQDSQASEPTAAEKKEAARSQAAGPVEAKDVNSLLPEPGEDVGESQVQEKVDAEQEAGFRGIKMDPTPNENYAAANSAVENDKPTPETDQDLRREAAASRQLDGPARY